MESMPKYPKPYDIEKLDTIEKIDKWLENNDLHWEDDLLLRISAKKGDNKIIKYLLSKGSDASSRRFLPIKLAIDFGNVESMRILLENVKDKLDASAIDKLLKWCGESEISVGIKNQITEILNEYR